MRRTQMGTPLIAQPAQCRKSRPATLNFLFQWSHRHEPSNPNSGEFGYCLRYFREFMWLEAVLADFPTDIHLQQHIDITIDLAGLQFQSAQKSKAIHGMNQVNPRQSGCDFVPL